jgi:hypothetical protein
VCGGCNPAAAAAIVADLGLAAVDAAVELVIRGKGREGTTIGGGEEALKYGSLLLLSSMLTATAAELKAAGGRDEDGHWQRRKATWLLLLGGKGGRECSHQGAGNLNVALT